MALVAASNNDNLSRPVLNSRLNLNLSIQKALITINKVKQATPLTKK